MGFHRTDLLDRILRRPVHGRFLDRSIHYIPPFSRCYGRWVPRQIDRYIELLRDVANSRKTQVHERVTAVRQLSRVPGSTAVLRALLTDPEIPVSEAALAGLAWTDDPAAALPTLLLHVDSDRARVALPAVARCARFVPPDMLESQLRPMLERPKVTTRKEAARLLGEYQTSHAVTLLAAAWEAPGQHRDVRRAIVSASRWLLDSPPVWNLLAEASAGEHAVAATLLEVRPYDIEERHRAGYAALVHRVAEADDPDTARLGLDALSRWLRWDPTAISMLSDRATDPSNTATGRDALSALVLGCQLAEDVEPLVAVVNRLVTAEASGDDQLDAAPDRDRPARQRLLTAVQGIATHAARSPVLRRAAAGARDALAGSASHREPAIRLGVAAIDLDSPDTLLDATAEFHALRPLTDRPSLVGYAAGQVGAALSPAVPRLDRQLLRQLAGQLATAESPAPAFALAITRVAGAEAGWPESWRTLLRELRQHPDPDVRHPALDTFTSPE